MGESRSKTVIKHRHAQMDWARSQHPELRSRGEDTGTSPTGQQIRREIRSGWTLWGWSSGSRPVRSVREQAWDAKQGDGEQRLCGAK